MKCNSNTSLISQGTVITWVQAGVEMAAGPGWYVRVLTAYPICSHESQCEQLWTAQLGICRWLQHLDWNDSNTIQLWHSLCDLSPGTEYLPSGLIWSDVPSLRDCSKQQLLRSLGKMLGRNCGQLSAKINIGEICEDLHYKDYKSPN